MTHKITMPDPMVEVDKNIVSSELQYTYLAPSGGLWHGTEFITTDQAESYANARVKQALAELRKLSDGAYCRYIDTLYRDECLGWEAKVKDGRFGEREFNAHKKAHEFLGQHRAFAEAIITICALIPKE